MPRLLCIEAPQNKTGQQPAATTSRRGFHASSSPSSPTESIATQPVLTHATFNSQSFVSSARQCRQCHHQCNHPLARSLTLLYFAIHYYYLHACMSCSLWPVQPALLCMAPISHCAPQRLILLAIAAVAIAVAVAARRLSALAACFLPGQLAPSTGLRQPGTWDLRLGPGTSHLESFASPIPETRRARSAKGLPVCGGAHTTSYTQ